MKSYFDKLTQVVKKESCYSNFHVSEVVITDAVALLNLLSNEKDATRRITLKDKFESVCDGDKCGQALTNLLLGLNGDSIFGCDLLTLTYDGDASSPLYYRGWMDQVAQKSG